MSIYLNSYHPLSKNKVGMERALRYKLPPFVDASCRREPDFESNYPSISSLCRGRNFAPRLSVDDIIVYITVKRDYLNYGSPHWRLTAILKVIERLDSHVEAADWYRKRLLPLPSNCMVPGNDPLPASMTAYKDGGCNVVLNEDRAYHQRAMDYGRFLVCKALYKALKCPPIISDQVMLKAFKSIPVTRNPPTIAARQLRLLVEHLGISSHVKQLDKICSR